MSRTTAREHAFKILFALQFSPGDAEQAVDRYLSAFVEKPVPDEDREFMLQEVRGTMEEASGLDGQISGALKGWTLSRLSRVDLSILRLALYEIRFQDSIPESVSINEAVNLAKKYSQEAAPAFINGILGSLVPKQEEGGG